MKQYTLDTHALVWHLIGSPKITPGAIKAIDSVFKGKAVGYVPMALMLELLWIIEVKDARLKIKNPNHENITNLSFDQVLNFLKSRQNIKFVELGVDDLITMRRCVSVGLELHDSIITTVAIKTNSVLITNDPKIQKSGLVKFLW